MKKYTETKTGLVAFYDIRTGNGAGLFLQPRSPHGAFGARVSAGYLWYTDLFVLFALSVAFNDDDDGTDEDKGADDTAWYLTNLKLTEHTIMPRISTIMKHTALGCTT